MFSGSYVALATPFRNGRVDEARLKWLVDYHVEHGTNGLVPCGSTGESATLSHPEHKRVVEVVVKTARGRIPVMAGAGSNSTEETLELVHHAARVGANSVLLVVPYYNKPTQKGLYAHFSKVAKATSLPIILYNIPGRTGIDMLPSTVVRLAKDCKTIVGIKEASGGMDYTSHLLSEFSPEKFAVFSGDDSLTLPLLSLGARGVISVIGNILPSAMSQLCRSYRDNQVRRAQALHRQMFPLMRALFLETNPIPIKAAMARLKMCKDELRLPLMPMSAEPRKKLYAAIAECPLIKQEHS